MIVTFVEQPSHETFGDVLATHGISVTYVTEEEFRAQWGAQTSSFTNTHHHGEHFTLTRGIDRIALYHEFGHLIHWVMCGKPAGSDFGMEVIDLTYQENVRAWVRSVAGPLRVSLEDSESTMDPFELVACAVEAALNLRHEGQKVTLDLLIDESWINRRSPMDLVEAQMAEMVRIGEAILSAYANTACKSPLVL